MYSLQKNLEEWWRTWVELIKARAIWVQHSKTKHSKLSIQKTKITTYSPITLWQIDVEKVETVTDFVFLGSKITAESDCRHKMKRHLLLGRKAVTNIDSILKSRQAPLLTHVCFSSVQFSCSVVSEGPSRGQFWRSLEHAVFGQPSKVLFSC